jgi:MoaA/NifB/PqqE/SkfB family radical SAM enzyme
MSLAVHATLTKRNIGDIEYLCKQAKELRYYQQFSLLLKPLTPSQQELGLSDKESREAVSEIIRFKKMGYPIFTSYRTLRNALEWPHSFHRARLDRSEIGGKSKVIRCFYGKLKIAIDADGFVYPCSSLNDTFNGLNVKEVGVKRAYEHVLKSNTCEACFYLTQNDWSLLLGGCLDQFVNQSYMQVRSIFGIY